VRRRLLIALSIAALGAGALAGGCGGKSSPPTSTTKHGRGGYKEQEHY
jgi:hypothetical protein